MLIYNIYFYIILISFFISFTLNPACSRVGKENLDLKHSVPHFSMNSALYFTRAQMKVLNVLFPRVWIEPTTCRVYSYMLVPLSYDWHQIIIPVHFKLLDIFIRTIRIYFSPCFNILGHLWLQHIDTQMHIDLIRVLFLYVVRIHEKGVLTSTMELATLSLRSCMYGMWA